MKYLFFCLSLLFTATLPVSGEMLSNEFFSVDAAYEFAGSDDLTDEGGSEKLLINSVELIDIQRSHQPTVILTLGWHYPDHQSYIPSIRAPPSLTI